MKNIFKTLRKAQIIVVYAVLFALAFPTSLLSAVQVSNKGCAVADNCENNAITADVDSAQEQEAVSNAKAAPEVQTVAEQPKEVCKAVPAPKARQAKVKVVKKEKKKAAKKSLNKTKRKAAKKTHKNQIKHSQQKALQMQVGSKDTLCFKGNQAQANFKSESCEYTPFSKALSKMQSTKSARQAEAQRLGITLPSESGNIADVSPCLSRLHTALQNIINRP